MDNSKYIDLYHIQAGYGAPKKDKAWHAAMRKIRSTHICIHCRKYPGDREYTWGNRDNWGAYTCFDCL